MRSERREGEVEGKRNRQYRERDMLSGGVDEERVLGRRIGIEEIAEDSKVERETRVW